MSVVTVAAPAKLNLALAVGPPESAGDDRGVLHPICSWMVTVGLFDTLEVTRLEDDRFSRYAVLWHDDAPRPSDIDWPITRDLAVRAHQLLEIQAGRPLPIQLKMEKRIPVGGGPGGGSSDAAAMLHAVNELYDLGHSIDELATLGATLGSDIPFLVRGGSAIVSGYGETLHAHDALPDLHAVILVPDAACPTGEVYDQYDDLGPAALRADDVHALPASTPLRHAPLFNDLEAAALEIAPELQAVRAQATTIADDVVRITGSGAAMFITCDDAIHAEHLAATLARELELPAIPVTAVPRASVISEATS